MRKYIIVGLLLLAQATNQYDNDQWGKLAEQLRRQEQEWHDFTEEQRYNTDKAERNLRQDEETRRENSRDAGIYPYRPKYDAR